MTVEGTPLEHSDWPTLVERVIDDVSRILRSEAQMFQTSLGAALELQIAGTIARLAIAAVMIAGMLCTVAATILLLHQWLPWWQAFGIAGVMMLAAGILLTLLRKTPEIEM
jgi:hypothetical protein